MSIQIQVLGNPGRDNALYASVNSGQRIVSLLFDCGQAVLSRLSSASVQDIDHLFFSHFHMDHVSGFDAFFRANFNRPAKPVRVWGPPQTIEIMHHRFRGFWWNLHRNQPGIWEVSQISADRVEMSRFRTRDAFATEEKSAPRKHDGVILADPDFTVETALLQHHGTTLGYVVRETARQNIDPDKLQATGLAPGRWVQQLKDGADEIEVDGKKLDGAKLRADLLVETQGESLAYLTDFLLDEATHEFLKSWLGGVDTVVCEAQYRHGDLDLAQRNHHTTTRQVAQIAKEAKIGKLVLFHLSQRYRPDEWTAMLKEARKIFPATSFPAHWKL